MSKRLNSAKLVVTVESDKKTKRLKTVSFGQGNSKTQTGYAYIFD